MKDNTQKENYITLTIIKDGVRNKYHVEKGISAAQALKSLNLFISNDCGGIGKCGKCKVRTSLIDTELAPEERRLLDEHEIKKGIRLACLVNVQDGMSIWLDNKAELFISDSGKDISKVLKSSKIKNIGAAVDIGTTTIAVSLIDISTGITLSAKTGINPQIKNGTDVISRISYVGDKPSRLNEMRGLVVTQVNWLIASALKDTEVKDNCISNVVISGNTVMLYLFQGINVQKLGIYPYEANFIEAVKTDGRAAGLDIAENGEVWILPCISAFLGADVIAGILAAGMHSSEKTSILVDLGTNGEIVAGNKYRLIGCSTAAGPAFEGAGIKCGGIYKKGAIDKVFLTEEGISYTTVDNFPANSICGSGIVDAAAALIEKGIVLADGKMIEDAGTEENTYVCSLKSRVKEYEGKPAFLIAGGENEIIFTQEDIRRIQLAKSAVLTGIKLIVDKLKINFEDLDKLYISGNFGNFINVENAVKIGLIPEELKCKIVSIGNSSLNGAIKCLLNSELINECSKIHKSVEYFDIGSNKDFHEIYLQNLNF